jgi:predicted O-methyltransferase YrrM
MPCRPFSPKDSIKTNIDLSMSIDGQVEDREIRKLLQLNQNVPKEQVIVEIGSYRGRSAVALALGSLSGNQNPVYSIDPHIYFRGIMGGMFGPEDQAYLYQNLTQARVGHIVFIISLPSKAAAKAWSEKNIGLLFIDGDHSYEAVYLDYEKWRPFLVIGSTIAFHDSNTDGVGKLIREMKGKNQIKLMGKNKTLQWFTFLG